MVIEVDRMGEVIRFFYCWLVVVLRRLFGLAGRGRILGRVALAARRPVGLRLAAAAAGHSLALGFP